MTGLSESTLRYYEKIGIIDPIARGSTSGHRMYGQEDVNAIGGIACLHATGMSISDILAYKDNTQGSGKAQAQQELLHSQQESIARKIKLLTLRQDYIDLKILYWKAAEDDDAAEMERLANEADSISRKLIEFK